jgi:hypothetical protein
MASTFSASQASKFMVCHASANLELAIPNWVPPERDDSADNAANRGTKMHEMFAAVMLLPTKDAAMMAKAIEYVSEVRARRRFKVLIEQPMKAMWMRLTPTTTADLVLYTADELHVFDLKTGKIPVTAVDNDQLKFYAATYGPLAPKAKEVHLHIVQPWADVMEEWVMSADDLRKWMLDACVAEVAIINGSTTFNPGDHCQFCPANPHGRGARGRPNCPAMMQLLYPQPLPDYEAMLVMADEE